MSAMKWSRFGDMDASLGAFEDAARGRLTAFREAGLAGRLHRKDATLWKTGEEVERGIVGALGWLDVPVKVEPTLGMLRAFGEELKHAGFERVVHMGMGGSSLAPLAFQQAFPSAPHALPVTVLDTTDPATVLRVEREGAIERTFFIEASKSGSTVESRSFGEYFYARVAEKVGTGAAGGHFAVITDPGSMLAELARERGYRGVFLNWADIGGRYSALSYFGLVPAVLQGVDVGEVVRSALAMRERCRIEDPLSDNPGVALGAIMGELATRGRDKVTFLVPDSLSTLGTWLEQLIAESTGKEGKGILPVAGENVGLPDRYGNDRLFVVYVIEDETDAALERRVALLVEAGHPVVVIRMEDRHDLGREFYRWEVATAAAGVVLGINPFDQPNVQESKTKTNSLLDMLAMSGSLPVETPVVEVDGISLVFDGEAGSVADALGAFFSTVKPGDFTAFLAYLTEDVGTEGSLDALRLAVRDRTKTATTLGFGPRYLHSTGQLHKGGPNNGLFVVITADDEEDAAIPGKPYSFGQLRRAQALGDYASLKQHGRRVLHAHLGRDVLGGLGMLRRALR